MDKTLFYICCINFMEIHQWNPSLFSNPQIINKLPHDVKNQLINCSIIHYHKINTDIQSKIDNLTEQCNSDKMKILCLTLIKKEYEAMINNPDYTHPQNLPTIFIMLRIEYDTIERINELINFQTFFNPVNSTDDIIELLNYDSTYKEELLNNQNKIQQLEQMINTNKQTINNFQKFIC